MDQPAESGKPRGDRQDMSINRRKLIALGAVVLLAGFIGRSRAPAALGVPYVKTR